MPEVLCPHLCPEVALGRLVVAVAPIGLQIAVLVVVVEEMVEAILPFVVAGQAAVHRYAILRIGNLEETPEGHIAVCCSTVAHGLLAVATDEVAYSGGPIG